MTAANINPDKDPLSCTSRATIMWWHPLEQDCWLDQWWLVERDHWLDQWWLHDWDRWLERCAIIDRRPSSASKPVIALAPKAWRTFCEGSSSSRYSTTISCPGSASGAPIDGWSPDDQCKPNYGAWLIEGHPVVVPQSLAEMQFPCLSPAAWARWFSSAWHSSSRNPKDRVPIFHRASLDASNDLKHEIYP